MSDFGVGSKELSDFFTEISVGKQKRKKELNETVGDTVVASMDWEEVSR